MRAFLYARKRMVNTLVKLIVSDMDGTLVDDDKNIDTEIFELLPKLKAAGMPAADSTQACGTISVSISEMLL